MKREIKKYYESLTDEELEQSYNMILDNQAQLVLNYYFAKEEKKKRAMNKNKRKVLKRGEKNE